MIGIIKCISQIIAEFIKFMTDEGFTKNTNIVIVADHLSMPNTVFDKLQKEPNRTLFNALISQEQFRANRENINHFSLAPTILYSLGLRLEDNRFGLGASGIGKISDLYVLDDFTNKELDSFFKMPSEKYLSLWFD